MTKMLTPGYDPSYHHRRMEALRRRRLADRKRDWRNQPRKPWREPSQRATVRLLGHLVEQRLLASLTALHGTGEGL